jgi:hypothetical protein
VALNRLRHILLHAVQLHCANNAVVAAGNARELAPLDGRVRLVADDLRADEVVGAVEDLLRGRVAVDGPVEHGPVCAGGWSDGGWSDRKEME